jgi:acetyl-CoA carboxylase carboxyltransferase component
MNKKQSREHNKQIIEYRIAKRKLRDEVMKAKKEFEYLKNRFNVKY